jgi:hypothetical protein
MELFFGFPDILVSNFCCREALEKVRVENFSVPKPRHRDEEFKPLHIDPFGD